MFWFLLLAHFLGDYPLQTTWMVRNKLRAWVLLLHVTIHFLTMLVVVTPLAGILWPYLLAIAAVHFVIDAEKNWISVHRPRWISWPYIADQLVHFVSLGLAAYWISFANPGRPSIPLSVALYAIGFLLVTSVWMVSERVLRAGWPAHGRHAPSPWPRLWVRAGLLAALLAGWNALFPTAAGLAVRLPYPANRAGLRVLLTDLLGTAAVAVFVIFAGK